jgi:hypothetical protein
MERVEKTPLSEDPNVLRYRELRDRMEVDTLVSSSLEDRFNHPAFAEIVEMGEAAVPIILKDMQGDKDIIFTMFALGAITGEDPTPEPEVEGGFAKLDMNAIKDAWLKWGEEKGHIQPMIKQES